MELVPKAGCVPWRRTEDGRVYVLLVTTTDGGRWIFPMGKIDPGEEAEEAAVRETAEEAGVLVEPGPRLPDLAWDDAFGRRNEVAMFLAAYEGETEWPESHKRERKWVSLDAEPAELGPDYGPILEAARDALD
jgi:8-oxo-dGTP pyrophosphatase MutT (NUDIX family)